jgi:hypothetical protein
MDLEQLRELANKQLGERVGRNNHENRPELRGPLRNG